MAFPYLTFHRHCWSRLQAINAACSAKLIKAYGPNYLPDESQLPAVISLLLELGAGEDGQPPDTKPLDDAAKEIKAWLDSGLGCAVGKKDNLGAFLGPDFGYRVKERKHESHGEDDEEYSEEKKNDEEQVEDEKDQEITPEQLEGAMESLKEHFEPMGVDVNRFIATYRYLKENEEQGIGWEEALDIRKEQKEDDKQN